MNPSAGIFVCRCVCGWMGGWVGLYVHVCARAFVFECVRVCSSARVSLLGAAETHPD